MFARRKQLSKVLVSMHSRVIIVLVYVLKALIIHNDVFKLKVNMCSLNCLKSRAVCFKFQIYVFGPHMICAWKPISSGTDFIGRYVNDVGIYVDLQLNFKYWFWLLWLLSVSACVVPGILKQPVSHRNDEKLQFEYLDVWSVFKPNYHVAGVTRELVNRLAIWVPVQYMLFYRTAPQPAVATVRGVTAIRNLE
jgi:hypothetical protein